MSHAASVLPKMQDLKAFTKHFCSFALVNCAQRVVECQSTAHNGNHAPKDTTGGIALVSLADFLHQRTHGAVFGVANLGALRDLCFTPYISCFINDVLSEHIATANLCFPQTPTDPSIRSLTLLNLTRFSTIWTQDMPRPARTGFP